MIARRGGARLALGSVWLIIIKQLARLGLFSR
jgi:hypothetical protein